MGKAGLDRTTKADVTTFVTNRVTIYTSLADAQPPRAHPPTAGGAMSTMGAMAVQTDLRSAEARKATERRTRAALDEARRTWEDACGASDQLKLMWERALFTPAGDAVGYYELHRKASEVAFRRSQEVDHLDTQYEQCVQSLADACAYGRHAAQRHAEAIEGLEPVDGSWHVAWRLLNPADPEQPHTEMPVFAGGRYERDDVEEVRIPGRRPPPRNGPTAAGSSSAHAGLAPGNVDYEDGAAPSGQAGAASAHVPSAAAPAGPPGPVIQAPAYPPPTGPEHTSVTVAGDSRAGARRDRDNNLEALLDGIDDLHREFGEEDSARGGAHVQPTARMAARAASLPADAGASAPSSSATTAGGFPPNDLDARLERLKPLDDLVVSVGRPSGRGDDVHIRRGNPLGNVFPMGPLLRRGFWG